MKRFKEGFGGDKKKRKGIHKKAKSRKNEGFIIQCNINNSIIV